MTKVDFKTSKGNIPLDSKLYKKYATAREIFDNENINFNGEVKISNDISWIIKNKDLSNIEEVKKVAIEIFGHYHDARIFYNNGYKIKITNKGIRESIEKAFYNDEQNKMLNQHLCIYSCLGYIIEHATLVTQGPETKLRNGILYWNYYFDGVDINDTKYSIEIEVRSMNRGENLYHIQRIEVKE